MMICRSLAVLYEANSHLFRLARYGLSHEDSSQAA
jgi:hypothetical protein